MRSTTLIITAAILAVTACGTEDADDPGSPSNDSMGGPDDSLSGEPVKAELVLLADSVHATVAPPTVLADPTSVQAYPGWFSADPDLYDQVSGALAEQADYPHPGQPLLAFTNGPGCASIDDAELMVDGSKVYAKFVGREHEECLAPHTQIAIFAVDRTVLPKDFALVGTDSTNAAEASGPGDLLAFHELPATADVTARGQEISDKSDLDAFVTALPSQQEQIRRAAASPDSNQRIFGFILTGCAAKTAELIATPNGVSAATVGGETVRCIRPVYYVAVFAVDAQVLPDARTPVLPRVR